jgi:hypothetical protein
MFSNESIKELGVAFIRRANGKELIEVCEELSNTIPLVPGVVVRYPLASFNRPALDLVKGAEVRHRQALERLSARSAVAKVLQDVPVLLEPYAGTKAMMFNHVETVTNSHGEQLVKLYAENDLRPQRERRWILKSLSELVPPRAVTWPKRMPDMTLVFADKSVPPELVSDVRDAVDSFLPIAVDLEPAHPSPKPPF